MIKQEQSNLKQGLMKVYEQQSVLADANFVTVYDHHSQKFQYYVQRLLGQEVDFTTSCFKPRDELSEDHKS